MNRIRFGLRSQLLLPTALLLLFPVLGYIDIQHWMQTLNKERQRSLQASAQIIVKVIEDNQTLLAEIPSVTGFSEGIDLYATRITTNLLMNGKRDDWPDIVSRHYGRQGLIKIDYPYTDDSLSLDLSIAANNNYVYFFLEIQDDHVIYRDVHNLSIHRNDHIQFALMDPDNQFHRYTFAAYQPGSVVAHVVASGGRSLRQDQRVKGYWRATGNGYNLEFQLPLALLGGRFAIMVTDVDDPDSREQKYSIGTADTSDPNEIGILLIPSASLTTFLKSFSFDRIRVEDNQQRIIADYTHEFSDQISNDQTSNHQTSRQQTADLEYLLAVQPIGVHQEIVGQLHVQQSNQAVTGMYNDALDKLLYRSVIIIVLGLIAWALVASIIVHRVRILRAEIESRVEKLNH